MQHRAWEVAPGVLSGLGLDDWTCFHTPGHCAGHDAFFRAAGGVLLAGDSVATVDLDSLPALVSWRKALSRPPTPAVTDETGIRSLPPAPFDPMPLVAAGVLAAGLGVPAARPGRRDRQVRPTVSAAN